MNQEYDPCYVSKRANTVYVFCVQLNNRTCLTEKLHPFLIGFCVGCVAVFWTWPNRIYESKLAGTIIMLSYL